MAYRAEIEIIARGVTKVTQLQKSLNQLANQIDHLNGPGSLGDFNKQLAQATKLMGRAQQGTVEEKRAIEQYVTALKNANGAQERTNRLITEEIRKRDGATASLKRYNAAAAPRRQPGGSMAGSYLRPGQARGTTQFAEPIGPEPSFLTGLSSSTGGRIRAIKQAQEAMIQAQAEVERVTRAIEQNATTREKANDKLVFDKKMAFLDAEHQKAMKLNKEENDAALRRFDQRLDAQVSKRAAAAKKSSRLREGLALGVGFPLLFGGGPGSVIGGAAGALAGGGKGGFGLQILGSAIGQQVDAFIQATAEAGAALTSTAGALEFVREKALFSSAENKELAAKLEEQGDAAGLAKLLTEELVDVIGNTGVEALGRLGTETQETTRLWNELTLQLQALIAGPLTDFLKIVNQFLGEQGNRARLAALQKDLAGTEAGGQLAAEIERLRPTSQILQQGETRTIKGVLDPKDVTALLEKFSPVRPPSTRIPVTAQDRRDITPDKQKQGRRSQVPDLKAELALQQRLLALNTQVAQAKRDENPVRQAALEMEIAMEKEVAKIAKIEAARIPEAEKILKKQIAELETSQEIEAAQNRLNDARAKQAEKGQEVIDSLEDEKALLQAKLKGTEDQVALTQLIAEKTEGLTEEDAKRVTELLKGVDALTKQNEQADKMQAIYDQIGQSIASGVVDTLSAAVDQTKSLADAAANTLRNIANILLQLGINTALQGTNLGIFKNLSGFASGGRPPVGKPSIVGERGPELFIPSTSGTIVPNGQFGGGATNVVVNVDASGTSASGDSGQAKQLGGLIGAVVQAELVKQQRPGGLLAR